MATTSSFDLVNFSGSSVYQDYRNVYTSSYSADQTKAKIAFQIHSPYRMLNNLEPAPDKTLPKENLTFKFNAIDNLATVQNNNTYYRNSIPYFFKNYICTDSQADINNIGKNAGELKVPLEYFINGEIFGINKIFQGIKDGIYLTTEKNGGWTFFDSFEDKKISKTNDLEYVIEAIYYNTYFDYFYNQKFFKVQTTLDPKNTDYTKKGSLNKKQIFDEKDPEKVINEVNTVYEPGFGEAPNFINVSVDSYQKIKNKVSLTTTAVRTNYNSKINAPKQIVFKDTKQELLSALKVVNGSENVINKFVDKLFLTSLSDDTLKNIIQNYIFSVAEYFNLVHHVLKSCVINYEFFKDFSKQPDDDIFDTVSDNGDKNKKIYLDEIKVVKSKYEKDLLIKRLGFYTKQLTVNLLNIIGSDETINNTINLFLDFLEYNEPQIVGNYKRQELFDIFKQINDSINQILRITEPQKLLPSKDGKVQANLLMNKYNILGDVIHSNDLILQKVYIYKTLEKPGSYENMLQPQNLHKVVEYATAPVNKNQSISFNNIKTIDDSVTTIEEITPNTKYYYCFLSQREYDIYSEIFKIKDMSRIVEHYSSPTKILELEMISTDNSTFLDYNFFIPESKPIVERKENFLSKIRVTPSEVQRDPSLYDKDNKTFKIPDSLLPFWTKVTKKVDSEDLLTGKTIKLRITSPKTKRKLDINIRHFIDDEINLGFDLKEITYEEIKNFAFNKNFKELDSVVQPIVETSVLDKNNKKVRTQEVKIIKYIQNNTEKYAYLDTDFLKTSYFTSFITDGFFKYLTNLKFTISMDVTFVDKTVKKSVYSKVYYPDQNSFYGPPLESLNPKKIQIFTKTIFDFLKDVNFVPNVSLTSLNFNFIVEDIYGFVYPNNNSSLTFKDVTPTYTLIDNADSNGSVNEGSNLRINIKTTNVDKGTKFAWTYQNIPNKPNTGFADFPSNFLTDVNATTFTIGPDGQGSIELPIVADSLTEGTEYFIIEIYDNNNNKVATSRTFAINDTSIAPTPIYTVQNPLISLIEGNITNISINAKYSKAQNLYAKINKDKTTAILDKDFRYPSNVKDVLPLTKSSDGVNSTTTLPIESIYNNAFSGQRTVTFDFYETINGPVIASATINITDASAQYFISGVASDKPIYEGYETTVIIDVTNVPDNTVLYWTLDKATGKYTQYIPISGYDFPANNGTVVINSSQGKIKLKAIADKVTEGDKYFDFNLRSNSINGPILATVKDIKLFDYSTDSDELKSLRTYLKNNSGDPVITNNGATIIVELTGKTDGGSVWGGGSYTPYYSNDSDFRRAIVHAGLVTAGKTAKIKFEFAGKQNVFNGSTSYGVQTYSFAGDWEAWKISLA